MEKKPRKISHDVSLLEKIKLKISLKDKRDDNFTIKDSNTANIISKKEEKLATKSNKLLKTEVEKSREMLTIPQNLLTQSPQLNGGKQSTPLNEIKDKITKASLKDTIMKKIGPYKISFNTPIKLKSQSKAKQKLDKEEEIIDEVLCIKEEDKIKITLLNIKAKEEDKIQKSTSEVNQTNSNKPKNKSSKVKVAFNPFIVEAKQNGAKKNSKTSSLSSVNSKNSRNATNTNNLYQAINTKSSFSHSKANLKSTTLNHTSNICNKELSSKLVLKYEQTDKKCYRTGSIDMNINHYYNSNNTNSSIKD